MDHLDEPKPVWSLRHSDLKETFEQAWEEMDPQSDDVVENISKIPKISSVDTLYGLPYRLPNRSPQFYLPKDELPAPLRVVKLAGNTSIACLLCGKFLLLRDMRNHIGIHLFIVQSALWH